MLQIINKLKIFKKQCLCKHEDVDMNKWYWMHGENGNETAYIIVEYTCKNCGKIINIEQRGQQAKEWDMVMKGYKYSH